MNPRLPAAPAWFRFVRGDAVHLGIVDPHGPHWFDLGALDVQGMLERGGLRSAHLRELMTEGEPMDGPGQLAVPVPRPGKILCLAKNYVAHAREFGAEAPKEPIFFAKLPDTLLPHDGTVQIPWFHDGRVDHEAELALVLGFSDPQGRGRKYVTADQAIQLVAGFTILNDVTARHLQGADREQKYPWLRSKSFDTFCPVGPFVVPADSFDGSDVQVTMRVNGVVKQQARTSAMVFTISRMLEAMSWHTTLHAGDLVATGTPEGVGPIRPGDRMEVEIEGLGVLANDVAKEAAPA